MGKESKKNSLYDWLPIFRGGLQIDSQGREHDGTEMIKKAIETFDPAFHEPPHIIGHTPPSGAPAYAWTIELKEEGGILYAKQRDINKEFSEGVKQGLWKKRSASFYGNGRLRHVAWLGAEAPAVKGLANATFKESEGPATFFDFAETGWKMQTMGRLLQNLRDWMIGASDEKTAERVIPQYAIDDIKSEPPKEAVATDSLFTEPGNPAKREEGENMESFTKAELDAQLRDQREKLETEFSERQAKAKARAKVHAENAAFVQNLDVGKVTPAMRRGLTEFMDTISENASFEFTESGEAITGAPIEYLKTLLAAIPKSLDFSEKGGEGTDPGKNSEPGSAAREEALGKEIARMVS